MHPDGGDAICGQSLCGPNITSIRPHCRSELFNTQSTAREQGGGYLGYQLSETSPAGRASLLRQWGSEFQ